MSPTADSSTGRKPTVAVCIPTYNQARYLRETIESVLAQDYPIEEIIVSDDASTDETQAICEVYALKLPNFRYFRQEKNLGMGANVDFVLGQATATYLARLDSDDRLLPNFLGSLVPELDKFPRAAYAHGDVWEIDGRGNRVRPRTLLRAPGFQTGRKALVAALGGYRVAANIVLIRTHALAEVDILTGFGDYVGDYHLAVGLARSGYGNVYVAEYLAEYRVWEDGKGVRARRLEGLLIGFTRVFKEQIEPAYIEAGFSLRPAQRARRTNALRYAFVLDSPQVTSEEKKRLKAHLIGMGDSARLRLVIWLIECRLGFIVRGYWKIYDFSRAAGKRCFKWLRRK